MSRSETHWGPAKAGWSGALVSSRPQYRSFSCTDPRRLESGSLGTPLALPQRTEGEFHNVCTSICPRSDSGDDRSCSPIIHIRFRSAWRIAHERSRTLASGIGLRPDHHARILSGFTSHRVRPFRRQSDAGTHSHLPSPWNGRKHARVGDSPLFVDLLGDFVRPECPLRRRRASVSRTGNCRRYDR